MTTTRAQVELVRRYVLDGLASGVLTTGDKLPAERQLAEQLGTSRAIVRQALMILESENRVTRQVGRGTFISREDSPATPDESSAYPGWPIIDTSPAQLMQARQLLEPQIAECVVLNATESDLRRIVQILESQRELKGDEFEQSDIDFHTAIAEATHNELIVAIAQLLNNVRQDPEWRKLKAAVHHRFGGRRSAAVAEHEAIVEALRQRNAAGAQRAMRVHLDKVRFNLLG